MQSITANDQTVALSDAFRCLVKELDKAGYCDLPTWKRQCRFKRTPGVRHMKTALPLRRRSYPKACGGEQLMRNMRRRGRVCGAGRLLGGVVRALHSLSPDVAAQPAQAAQDRLKIDRYR